MVQLEEVKERREKNRRNKHSKQNTSYSGRKNLSKEKRNYPGELWALEGFNSNTNVIRGVKGWDNTKEKEIRDCKAQIKPK